MAVVTEKIEQKVLKENDRIAAELRAEFTRRGILALNLISSPGSGKTSLLERTLATFRSGDRVAVLTGDIQTDNDARRLAHYGFAVKQITTAGACHLDARMVARAVADWDLTTIDLLLIENVGNLVCPASYDLGEAARAVLLSVTEGDDKPLKYPGTFYRADVLLITKTDLLPYVPFSVAAAAANAQRIRGDIEVLEVSALSGQGMAEWRTWLAKRMAVPSPVFA